MVSTNGVAFQICGRPRRNGDDVLRACLYGCVDLAVCYSADSIFGVPFQCFLICGHC
jgi:hypothetical protein